MSDILMQLTLEEKCALLQGWTTWTTLALPKLQIPSMFMSDGPHGLRKQAGAGDHLGLNASVPATCFPTAATMANSWDEELGEKLGRMLGEEAAANDVHVVLGPGLNIKRSPLCGRNFEYFSEDPILAGKMTAAYVRGIQKNGVAACPKHFAVNSQELRRMSTDSVVDERTLREIYLTGFEIAVKESAPKAVMSSYNQVNGTYSNENRHLLTEILRDEWGFDGYVVTDWGGDNDHAQGILAGSNLTMPAPGADCALGLYQAVQEGKVPEAVLDERIRELLKVVCSTHKAVSGTKKEYDIQAHHQAALEFARGSIVLLENDGVLPLDSGTPLAVIGDFAQNPRYQGSGSSVVNPTRVDNLLDCLKNLGANIIGFAPGYSRTDPAPDQKRIDEAVSLAENAAMVLLCVGLDEIAESEGLDRTTLNLSPGQQALISAVCGANRNVVLVLSGGAPFIMPEAGSYRAALHGYLWGQAGAAAMAEAIFGHINPSGKLNETWPLSLEDTPTFRYYPSKERTSEYREALYVGYRYYETAGVPVRYPFGYGMSYTTFEYSGLSLEKDRVCFTLTNTGAMDGAEVVQVYVCCKDGKVFRPAKELKAFRKVFLKAGEQKTIEIDLDDRAYRFFNVKTGKWEMETAHYTVMVAASVSDIRLSGTVYVKGNMSEQPYPPLPAYESGRISQVSDEEFETILGRPIPDGRWTGELTANDAICQMYYAKSAPARLVHKILTGLLHRAEASGKPDLNILFIYNMPFRAIGKMAGGLVSERMVEDILLIVNGHFWRGAGRFIGHFFRNQKRSRAFVGKLRRD